eukprot:g22117.t1
MLLNSFLGLSQARDVEAYPLKDSFLSSSPEGEQNSKQRAYKNFNDRELKAEFEEKAKDDGKNINFEGKENAKEEAKEDPEGQDDGKEKDRERMNSNERRKIERRNARPRKTSYRKLKGWRESLRVLMIIVFNDVLKITDFEFCQRLTTTDADKKTDFEFCQRLTTTDADIVAQMPQIRQIP